MKTVSLPLFPADFSATNVLGAAQRSGGAVVRSGEDYHLVLLDDVADALKATTSPTLDQIRSRKVNAGGVLEIVGAPAHVRLNSKLLTEMPAPLYACPEGDYVSSSRGTCPVHRVPLDPV